MAFDSQTGHRLTPALILGGDTVARERIGLALSRGGFVIREASQLTEALEALEHEPSSLIFAIADPHEPDLINEIKKRAPESEIILVADHPSLDSTLDALRCAENHDPKASPEGTKPVPPGSLRPPSRQMQVSESELDTLRRKNEELKRINRVLMENSLLDPHTGLHNERFLLQMVECEIVRSRRYNRSFTLIFLNIELVSASGSEQTEAYNLRLVQALAAQLRNRLRRSDLLACYQDGIFGILLPETDREDAYGVADALCRLIETNWMLSFADRTSMTLGLATFPEDGDEASELFRHAIRQISH